MLIRVNKDDFIKFESFIFSLEILSQPVDIMVEIEGTKNFYHYTTEYADGCYRYVTL